MTEARVAAERALAEAMQQYATDMGMYEWAGQVISMGDSNWFGGVELSPVSNNMLEASRNLQQLEPGLEFVQVCAWMCHVLACGPGSDLLCERFALVILDWSDAATLKHGLSLSIECDCRLMCGFC